MKPLTMTENRTRALKALGFFQYLVLEQFLRLGITTDKSNLTKRVLQPLRQAALVECKKRSATDEDIYCLKKRGAELLAEIQGIDAEGIIWPKDGVQYSIDARHRKLTIDFLISLKLWADAGGGEIDFIAAYYQKRGAQRQKGKKPCYAVTRHWIGKTKEVFEPDLEFRIQMGRESRLFAFEFHAGRDALKIVGQLMLHTTAIKAGTLSKHHDHPFSNYVLSVYHHAPTMRSVQARLAAMTEFAPFRSHFLLNTLEALQRQFSEGWQDVGGQPVDLFSRA